MIQSICHKLFKGAISLKKMLIFSLSIFLLTACSPSNKKDTELQETKESSITKKTTASSKTKKRKTKETSSPSSTSSEAQQDQQASLSDFVGGWGIPQSGNLFFINADGTYSSATTDNAPLGEMTFSVLADKRLSMISSLGEMIKELDGSLTAKGQNYQYLGNITKEQLLAQNNNTNNNADAETPTDNPDAAQKENAYDDGRQKEQTNFSQILNDQTETAKQEIRNYFSTLIFDKTNKPYEHVDFYINDVFKFLEADEYPIRISSKNDEEYSTSLVPIVAKYKQKAIDRIIWENEDLYSKNQIMSNN
jgi:hypothetical protein